MKLSKKKIIILGVVLAGVVGLIYFVGSLNKPAEGTVKQVTSTEEKPPEYKTIAGEHITFQYPERFSEASNSNPSASLEHWILVTRLSQGAGQTGQISLSIAKLPEGGVKENSSYKHINAFTDKYKLSDASYSDEPVIIATRIDPSYERTALWQHKNLLLTATLTSSTENEQLNREFDELLRSMQWQP